MQQFNTRSLTAIILAGGKSSRMGQDKALLPWKNQTLLFHVCNVARELANYVYIVTPREKVYRDCVPEFCKFILETQVLENEDNNCPLIGFFQGLQVVETEWVLLLACDLPWLDSTVIKKWLPSLDLVDDRAIAFLPRRLGLKDTIAWEPLCGFYRRNCLLSLSTYLDRGDRSFQDWLRQNFVEELPIEDRSILFNCNTKQDWERVSKIND